MQSHCIKDQTYNHVSFREGLSSSRPPRSVYIKDVVPGMILGRAIESSSGVVLLNPGTCLSVSQVEKLKNWGVPFIYVTEESGDHLDEAEDIGLTKKEFVKEYAVTIRALRETFNGIRLFKDIPINEIRQLVDNNIVGLVNTVGVIYYMDELRRSSDYTFQHSVNVSLVAGVLGTWLNYSLEEKKDLMLAGLLHDIGKLFTPLAILDKPGSLSAEEFEIMKKHSEEGYQLLQYTDQITGDVKLGVLQHHERLDGSGYPKSFKNEEIHEYAKIVAIADMYDAMVSDRSYRRKLTPLAAAEAIADEMYNKLDPRICFVFLQHMRNYVTGNGVLLSNGQRGTIFIVESGCWTKPVVQTLDGAIVDLRKENISVVDFEMN